MNSERAEELKERAERIRVRGPPKIKLVLDIASVTADYANYSLSKLRPFYLSSSLNLIF